MNLFSTTGAAQTNGIPAGAEISNIEVVNIFDNAGSSIDDNDTPDTPEDDFVADVNASVFGAAAQEIWQVGGTPVGVAGLGAGQTAGFRNNDATATVAYKDDVTAANVVLENVADDSVISVRGDDLTEVSVTASINPTGATKDPDEQYKAGLVIDLDDPATAEVTSLNVSLSQNTDLRINNADELETVDASASTGGIAMDLSVAGNDDFALETATTGSGVDIIQLAQNTFSADSVSLDLGAGADTVAVLLSSDEGINSAVADLSITGGSGSDDFAFGNGNIILNTDADAFGDAMSTVSVTDFGDGDDTLSLWGFGTFDYSFAAENAVTQALETLDDDAVLFDAVSAVAAAVEDDGAALYAQFEFDGSTYLYGDVSDTYAGDGLDTGDMLINLGDATLDANNVVGLSELPYDITPV